MPDRERGIEEVPNREERIVSDAALGHPEDFIFTEEVFRTAMENMATNMRDPIEPIHWTILGGTGRTFTTTGTTTNTRRNGRNSISGGRVVLSDEEPLLPVDSFFEEGFENDEEEHILDEDGEIIGRKKLKSKTLDENETVKLYLGGTAKIKDCTQTFCGRWFLKGDKHIVTCIADGREYYKGDCNPVITKFDNEGKPITKIDDDTKYVHCHNVKSLTTILVTVSKELHVFYILYENIPLNFYKECIEEGVFYHIKDYPTEPRQAVYRKVNAIKRKDLLDLADLYKFGIKSPTYNRTEGKQYTFGIELETSLGILPSYLDKDLSYQAVHDGSLRDPKTDMVMGAEYVTGILTGDTGLLQTKRLCNALTKYCKVNNRCGMHQHIGGANFNKPTVIFMYKLFKMVENEIFSILPPSRRNNEYCRKLNKIELRFSEEAFNDVEMYNSLIDLYYNEIVKFIGSTVSVSSAVNKKTDHPKGHKCNYDHSTSRYCWVNFVSAIFDTRGNGSYTLEIRNHPGTTSYEKVKYWLLICMGLVWFAENHQKRIALSNSISLEEIMNIAYPKYGGKINNYIMKRYRKFNQPEEKANKLAELDDYQEFVEPELKLSIKNL